MEVPRSLGSPRSLIGSRGRWRIPRWPGSSSSVRHLRAVAHRSDWRDPDVLLALAEVESRLAFITRDRVHFERATRSFEEAIEAQPRSGRARLVLGEVRAALGDLESARVAYLQAADLLPRDPVPLVDVALLALAEGDRELAVRHLDAALRVDPSHPAVEALRTQLQRK